MNEPPRASKTCIFTLISIIHPLTFIKIKTVSVVHSYCGVWCQVHLYRPEPNHWYSSKTYLQPSLSLFNYGNLKQKSDLFKRTRKSAAQITLRNLAAIWKKDTNLPRASKTRPCKDDNLVFISKNEALASAEEEVHHFRKVLVSLVTFASKSLSQSFKTFVFTEKDLSNKNYLRMISGLVMATAETLAKQ